MSRASQALHTSQPAISKQITLLEQELGVVIFHRKGKHILGLTEVGREIHYRSLNIAAEFESIRRLAGDARDKERGSLSIATTHTQSRYVLPAVIQQFSARYPKVQLQMLQGTPRQVAELTSSGAANFGIATESLQDFENLLVLPAFRWNRVVLVPKKHPLTKLKKITLKDIAEYPLLTYVAGFTGRAKVDEAFLSHGLEPHVAIAASDADVINTYVRLGMGIGIIASMAVDINEQDLVALDASHLFDWSVTYIAMRREYLLREYMLDFINFFAPHLTPNIVKQLANCENQAEFSSQANKLKLPFYS